ncbi:hypothetical protein RRG08_016101 [Elysia crispata]|uniref:Uncharacterized protein n=1 Tax=Elysia crispata TaxID=231223 RepID=A0AAE0ZNV9_9GAST|nr:hypothetical protein RRG08_016101 [Elysia crispata]
MVLAVVDAHIGHSFYLKPRVVLETTNFLEKFLRIAQRRANDLLTSKCGHYTLMSMIERLSPGSRATSNCPTMVNHRLEMTVVTKSQGLVSQGRAACPTARLREQRVNTPGDKVNLFKSIS